MSEEYKSISNIKILLICVLIGSCLQPQVLAQEDTSADIILFLENDDLLVRAEHTTSITVEVQSSSNNSLEVSLFGKWIGNVLPENINVTFSKNMETTPYISMISFASSSLETGYYTYQIAAMSNERIVARNISIHVFYNHTISVDTDQKNYEKGEQIHIFGEIGSNPIDTTTLSSFVTIHIRHDDFYRYSLAPVNNNTFDFLYPISFGDPEGTWTIIAEIEDDGENKGMQTTNVTVAIPADIVRYTVVWSSPPENANYRRGDTFNVSVMVTEDGVGVTNATTQCIVPSLHVLNLPELEPGYYQQSYAIPWDAPLNSWMLTVESKKGSEENIEVGGSNATIIVKPATLKMTMIEPSKDSYQKHGDIPFQITLLYPNEEIVENATITVNSSEQQQELTYQGNGSYQGFFISQETNQKNLMFTVHATDSYGNTVTDYQLVYIIDSEQGAVPLILVISLTGLVIIAFLMVYFLKNNIIRVRFEDINTEIEEINQLQKEAVLAYYQKGSISRNAYERLRKEHEQRLAELQNKKMKKNNSNMK